MSDLLRTILKWIIIAIVIVLLIVAISNIVNVDKKKKGNKKTTIETTTIDRSYEKGESDTNNQVSSTSTNTNTNNQASLIDTPDTSVSDVITMCIGLTLIGYGSYYIYSRKKESQVL